MKKLFLILAVLLSVATLSAQSYRQSGTKYLVRGAYNIVGEGGGDWAYKGVGLNFGYGWQFNPNWYLGGTTGLHGDHGGTGIPLMVEGRWYWFDAKNTPYLSLRTGLCLDYSFEPGLFGSFGDYPGWLTTSEIGYAFGHLTVGIWYTSYFYTRGKIDNTITYMRVRTPMISVGWEF